MGGGTDKVLDIKAADLKASAPTFSAQSEALRKAADELHKALQGLGKPWGDDERGEEFDAVYSPALEKIKKSTGILVEGLASIHVAMADMADGHIENDALVASMFTRIPPQGGDGAAGGQNAR
ncbi:hypothetical protein [Streptomyces sp. NPDC012888]|uniref:hypothetical protein n=1 Tax=Streptomyces sp. NPDC012888 TaxID=3364855 RepID=UPI0036B6C441